MFHLNTLILLFIFSRSVSSGLVPRQWEQMPLCARECAQSAPLGTCNDTDWNCLCRTDSFMLSNVSCISGHCARLGVVDISLRALEGQCKANSVVVVLSPSPPAPPRPPQTSTPSVVLPQSTDRSSSPSPTPTPTSTPRPTPPSSPTQVPQNSITTSIATNIPPDSTTVQPLSTPPTNSDTGKAASIPATPSPGPSTTISGSNFIGADLNANDTNTPEKGNFSLAVPIIAGVASGAAVFILALVAFFLMYIRRLKRERYYHDQLDTRQVISSASDILPQTRWGHSPMSSLNQRPTTPSSQHITPSRIDQFSLLPPCNPFVRKGQLESSPAPLSSRYDGSNSSDIYVRHQDSGLSITPSNYGVVELPPEYMKDSTR